MNVYRTIVFSGALAIVVLTIALWIGLPRRFLKGDAKLSASRLGIPYALAAAREAPVLPLRKQQRPRLSFSRTTALTEYAAPDAVIAYAPGIEQPAETETRPETAPIVLPSMTDVRLSASDRFAVPHSPGFLGTRPQPLLPLYASFAALQVADAISTVKALQQPGLREVNPLVRPFARNVPAMLAVKAASTAVTVIAVEKLWKRNRLAAVATMISINAAYGVIVSRNVSVDRGRPESR